MEREGKDGGEREMMKDGQAQHLFRDNNAGSNLTKWRCRNAGKFTEDHRTFVSTFAPSCSDTQTQPETLHT